MLRMRSGVQNAKKKATAWSTRMFPATTFRRAINTQGEAQALVYSKSGPIDDVLSLKTDSLPKLGPNSVHVKMLAAPLHVPFDLEKVGGIIGDSSSGVGGSEGVGVVVNVGSNVKVLAKDDLVVPAPQLSLGTWRTQLVVNEDQLLTVAPSTKKDQVNIEQAAVGTIGPCTAYRLLSDFAHLENGDVVVQNNADSIVGQAVIQIAKKKGLKTINLINEGPDYNERVEGLKAFGGDVVTGGNLPRHQLEALLSDLPAPKLGVDGGGQGGAATIARLLTAGNNTCASLVTYAGTRTQPFALPYSTLLNNGLSISGFNLENWGKSHSLAEFQEMLDNVSGMDLQFWLEKKDFNSFEEALSSSRKNKTMPQKGHAARTTVMLM
eukprot:g4280.t1